MYYVAYNPYGSETSCGFANTWTVIGFRSLEERFRYVRTAGGNQGVVLVTRKCARLYARFCYSVYASDEITPIDPIRL